MFNSIFQIIYFIVNCVFFYIKKADKVVPFYNFLFEYTEETEPAVGERAMWCCHICMGSTDLHLFTNVPLEYIV